VGLFSGITLFLAATGVAVDLVVERHFRSELDRSLTVLLESNVTDVIREAGRHALQRTPYMSIRPGAERGGGGRRAPSLLFAQHTDVLLQAWNAEGDTIVRSDALGEADLPLLAAVLTPLPATGIPADELFFADIELPTTGAIGRAVAVRFTAPPEGRRARFVFGTNHSGSRLPRGAEPVLSGEVTAGEITTNMPVTGPLELVIAQDTSAMAATLSRLRWLLALGWVISSLGCAAIVSWIVHRGLRPLEGLRRQMGRAQGVGLQQDFALPDAPGELQPVVTQLNALMGRIRSAFVREKSFTSDVAHEMRTPLAGLRSTLEVALSRPREQPEYRKAVETSLAITLEMQSLVEMLLAMARTSNGSSEGEIATAAVSDLLEEARRPYSEDAARKRLEWTRNIAPACTACTDLPLFRRVLQNLFENAVSYAEEGSSIEIDARSDDDGGLMLSVSNRVGEVPENLAERAFDAFWRADVARSATGRHAGLGLPLCRRILSTLGGSIDAACDDDRFTVTLSLPGGLAQSTPNSTSSAANAS
jgi:signal transduction histidine kinase